MKFLYILILLLTCNVANGQSYGEMLNDLQHAISNTIVNKDTLYLKRYFDNKESFHQAKDFLFSISKHNKKLKMTTEQIGVFNKAINGIDSLTIVYMGGDDDKHVPKMLGQIIFTTKPGAKDWLFSSIKSIVPANEVKDPLRYLRFYIGMHGMPPPSQEELK